MGNTPIIITMKPQALDNIGYAVNSLLRSECYESTLAKYDKMEKFTTFSSPFLRSSLPPDRKIICPRISFRVKKIVVENQYNLY